MVEGAAVELDGSVHAEQAHYVMPLEKAPWADRFGVTWMVNISGAGSA